MVEEWRDRQREFLLDFLFWLLNRFAGHSCFPASRSVLSLHCALSCPLRCECRETAAPPLAAECTDWSLHCSVSREMVHTIHTAVRRAHGLMLTAERRSFVWNREALTHILWATDHKPLGMLHIILFWLSWSRLTWIHNALPKRQSN